MKTNQASQLATLLLATTLLSSCAVGPDWLRPSTYLSKSYTPEAVPDTTVATDTTGGAAQHLVPGGDIPAQWWELYHSPVLNSYVEQALAHNPDLQATEASLRQAREQTLIQEGSFYPTVNGTASVTRQKVVGASFGIPGLNSIYTLYNAQANVSYTLDVFGGLRRAYEAEAANEEYERYQLEAAYLSLTANVVTAAVSEASYRAQIAATQQIIAIEENELKLLNTQFELGAVAKSDVLLQEATLQQSRALLPPLEKQLAANRTQLMAYLGKLPAEDTGEQFTLDNLSLPETLPVSLPSQLIDQRPDIRAAEATLHFASAEIGVETANLLPQFTITGDIGNDALRAAKLFNPGSGLFSIGGTVTQPLFHGFALWHGRQEAEAQYDQALAEYRSTVVGSFRQVADALRAIQFDAQTLQASTAAARASKASLDLSQQQYGFGSITYVTLLNAQQTYQNTLINEATANANRYADTAALFQALGGGWWQRNDVHMIDGHDEDEHDYHERLEQEAPAAAASKDANNG
jgi:NodT family efflux transporter outer membrane factor (OMF) lipoprotein